MRIANWLDQFAIFTGHSIKWLAIIMLLVQFGIVISRYAFGINSIALQELVLYLHASLFMVAAAYTLQVDGHVRVDIFYSRFTPKNKALIDILGARNFFAAFNVGYPLFFLAQCAQRLGNQGRCNFGGWSARKFLAKNTYPDFLYPSDIAVDFMSPAQYKYLF